MKEILLVGKSDSAGTSILQKLGRKFRIKKASSLQTVDEIMSKSEPDFVLCAGKIKINEEGRYYLEM